MRDYTLKNLKGFKLDQDQNELVEFMLGNDNSFNCAQTGFGKTFTTITAAVHKIIERKEENIHFILLVPNAATKAFEDTLGNILGVPYNIYTTAKRVTQTGARFTIFNYNTLSGKLGIKRNSRGEIISIDTNPYFEKLKDILRENKNSWLVCDEAHVMQDPSTQQYMLMEFISEWFVGKWFLTATPILNDLDGFFHMTQLVQKHFWGTLYQFKARYQILENDTLMLWNPVSKKKQSRKIVNIVGYQNLDLMTEKFKQISMIKSKQYELNFQYLTAKMSKEFDAFYSLAADGLLSGKLVARGEDENGKKVTHGARMHDLQRVVSNSHKDLKLWEDNKLTEKEALLVTTIGDIVNRGEAALVYLSYRETLERVKTILGLAQDRLGVPTIHEIHGDIKQAKRKQVEKNIEPGDIVLITSLGTESVNLQRANNLIFYEVPFALRQFIQACGRITRTDTTFNIFNIYILEAEGTIDTYKKNRIIANSEVIKSVLGGSNALPTSMLDISLEDIKEMKGDLLWRK